jgi:flagellar motor switch protein FliG
MKVQILKTCLATIDGFTVQKFYKGKVYDLREFVASNLINQRKARFVSDELGQSKIIRKN